MAHADCFVYCRIYSKKIHTKLSIKMLRAKMIENNEEILVKSCE